MIRPTRHMDLEAAPLRLATIVLEELSEASALRLDDLQSFVSQQVPADVRKNLSVALQLLFLLGLLDYDPSSDAIFRVSGEIG